MSEAATLIAETAAGPTPLSAHLRAARPDLVLRMHAGALTPQAFSDPQQELAAAVAGAAVFDLGYRSRIRVTGEDRVRWLNGMVSNAIQTLPDGSGNYNFILNAQGRIQGDACVYGAADHLILDTDRSQTARLFAHLDHFIIMDDVELHSLDDAATGIGLTGPQAAALLGPGAAALAVFQFAETEIDGVAVTLVHAYSPLLPRFELWLAPDAAARVWTILIDAGAAPVGIEAVENLRVMEGTPRYGVDITDRHLPQETSQTRALNFAKGCYLGQEIVERIRSRATVHRSLRQFALHGEPQAAPLDLRIAGDPAAIGQLTSVAEIRLPEFTGTLALGFIRNEAIERKARIEYDGGAVEALDSPPTLALTTG